MDNIYRNNLKNKLRDIREKKNILSEREKKLDIFNNPSLAFGYLSNPRNLLKVGNLKAKIGSEKDSLHSEYVSLREEYKNRFVNFDNFDLFRKYDSLNNRFLELERRYDRVKSLNKNDFLFKISKSNRKLKKILGEIEKEKGSRERARDDALNELWNRGICLEIAYTQNMFDFVK